MLHEKINFVIDCSDTALAEYKQLSEHEAAHVFVRGDLNWCLQSYLILSKRNNLPIFCSNQLYKDCINIIHSDTLLNLKGVSSHFIVCVRADYPSRLWAHYHLVQNKNQVSQKSSYVPHWVQPGLSKRIPDSNRKFRVAYAGQPSNGNLAGTSDSWKRLLEPHDIDFVVLNAGEWHDLSSVDVLVGIRSFDKKPHNTKPPTKLFNAWHAEIPFIGGNDSAFKQVGKPGEDYLLATTPDEALSAIIALKNNSELYQQLVQNGKRKAQTYSEDQIAAHWEQLLTGPILNRYEKWQSRIVYERIWFNLMKSMAGPHNRSKKLIRKFIKIN